MWTYTMEGRRCLMKITVMVSCLRLCESQYSHNQNCDMRFSVIVPKSGDCSTFLRCVNSKWSDYKCPVQGVFNTTLGMCTRPEYNPRCNSSTTDFYRMKTVKDDCVYPCPEDGSVYMYPKWGQCNQFYVCRDRQLYLTRCSDIPPRGTYRFFNFFMFSCDRRLESNNVCRMSGPSG